MTINRFYGILTSQSMKYKCNNITKVTESVIIFWKNIINKYENNICYIDTDEIYFKLDNYLDLNLVDQSFDSFGLPYKKNDIRKNSKDSLYKILINSNMPENLQTQIIYVI
jgi:hypothetical protein